VLYSAVGHGGLLCFADTLPRVAASPSSSISGTGTDLNAAPNACRKTFPGTLVLRYDQVATLDDASADTFIGSRVPRKNVIRS
jgi:hypothetical protein